MQETVLQFEFSDSALFMIQTFLLFLNFDVNFDYLNLNFDMSIMQHNAHHAM